MKVLILLRRTKGKLPKRVYVSAREILSLRKYKPLRFVVHKNVGFGRYFRGNGYTVSELSTCLRCSGGSTRKEALFNASDELAGYSVREIFNTVRRGKKMMRSREYRKAYGCA